jgi:polyisoprenoid-binding protein YceI
MSTELRNPTDASTILQSSWRLDPARSSVAFEVRHFYGLITVKGRFTSYEGTLDLGSQPAVELTIDAASVDTNQKKRDKHLRSGDFFDVEHHPELRFVSEAAVLDGEQLRVRGSLRAAGGTLPLDLEATVRPVDDEIEIEAVAHIDHRRLGLTWNPLRLMRSPSKAIIRGRAVRGQAPGATQEA